MDYTSLITCLSQNEGVSGTDMEIRYEDSLTRYISTLETQLGISRNTKSLSSTLLQISESLLWLKEKKKKPTRLGNVRSVDVWFREREKERKNRGEMSGRRVSCAVGARLKWQKHRQEIAGEPTSTAATAAGAVSAFGN